MSQTVSITIRVTPEEREWLKRKAHWQGATVTELLREHIRYMVREEGYLRPPDDEHQDFGFEKEMMQFVNAVSHED